MMVDLMLMPENLGYHEENWNASSESCVNSGNIVGLLIADGIGAERRALEEMVVTERG